MLDLGVEHIGSSLRTSRKLACRKVQCDIIVESKEQVPPEGIRTLA